MNDETSLSSLYRRLAASRAAPAEARLGAMLRELEADSEALAADVARLRRPAHAVRGRDRRHATDRRVAAPLRWISGLAACLAVTLGVLAIQGQPSVRWRNVSADVRSVAAPAHALRGDRIFASGGEAAAPAGDVIFRGSFSARGS